MKKKKKVCVTFTLHSTVGISQSTIILQCLQISCKANELTCVQFSYLPAPNKFLSPESGTFLSFFLFLSYSNLGTFYVKWVLGNPSLGNWLTGVQAHADLGLGCTEEGRESNCHLNYSENKTDAWMA